MSYTVKGQTAALFASITLLAAACVSDDPDPNAAVLSPDEGVEVVLSEFNYLPSNLTVVAGSTVTLTLVNEGLVDHEFMVGEDLAEGGGFQTDLLVRILTGAEGVRFATAGVTFAEASGDHAEDADADADHAEDADAMDMGAMTDEEMAAMDDGDADADHAEDADAMDMGAMTDEEMAAMDDGDGDADHAEDADAMDMGAMTDEEMAAMDDGDADADHAEDGDAMDMGAMTDEEMAAMDDGGHAGHSGAAVTVMAGGRVELQFVVPDDAVGTWTFGCFIEGHFKAGMNGTITVLPSTA